MSLEIIGVIGLFVLILLLFFRLWAGTAKALIGFLGYACILGFRFAFGIIAQIPFTTVGWYPMSTVPLFILMGVILCNLEVGADLFNTAYKWVGHLRGGLAMASVIACALFASITGLIYGILTQQSIGALFIAGILPGVLLTALLIGTIVIITTLDPEAGPAGPQTSFKEKILSLKNTWHTILLFFIVLGGIYGGFLTLTEAGAIGAFGAIMITALSGRLTIRRFLDSLLEAAQTTAMVFLKIIGTYILMKFLAVSRLPFALAETVANLPLSRVVIFLGIVLMYIVLGMFLDIFLAVIINETPIFVLRMSISMSS